MTASTITWDIARTGGMVAFVLLTASVSVGLLLSIGWRSATWTRLVTNEVHRFVTLLAITFTVVHTVAVGIDPFIKLSPPELLVPFLSSYRPIWVTLGIISTYLLIAIYLSDRLRSRVGYAWWRRFHALAFLALVMALVHGIGTGSDTRTIWGLLVYGGSLLLVGGLLAARLFPRAPKPSKPLAATLGIATVAAVAAFVIVGPLAPGWSARAGGIVPGAALAGSTSPGSTTGTTGPASPSPAASATPAAAELGLAFGQALPFSGRASGGDSSSFIDVTAQLADGSASFHMQLSQTADGGATGPLLLQTRSGVSCGGNVTGVDQTGISATCQTTSAAYALRFGIQSGGRRLTGTLTVSPSGAAAPSPGAGGQTPGTPGGGSGSAPGTGGQGTVGRAVGVG